VLKLSPDNPLPFAQPFLELTLGGEQLENVAPKGFLCLIDVGGQIEKYITKKNTPTRRLIDLCKSFAKAGVVVKTYTRYNGSAGPHAILRNGALFYRMDAFENPPEEVHAYQYRAPEYRGSR